ncbi:hypothetical protein ACIPWE_38510 [Streptomyces sp. NPDC090073]|uniref:hypothetical protein n=1 Tax=Streptomyces sp. NPDC090073 TaxID=3365936 RepID=UPI00382B9957
MTEQTNRGERRKQYAAAMDAVTGGICPGDLIDAVMAVADGELAAVRAGAFEEAAIFVRDAHFDNGLTVQEITTALGHTADRERRLAGEAQQHPECRASISGNCLAEAQSEGPCDTDDGECVHGGRPAREAQQDPAPSPVRCPDAFWLGQPEPPHDWEISPGKTRPCPGVEAGGGQEDGSAPA